MTDASAALHITPPIFLADPALRAVMAALPHARLVGGCVRDTLASRPLADIDLATPDPPEAVISSLEAAGLRAIPTGLAHGTVTALALGQSFEITTLRRDIETDGRHAIIAFTDDWRLDAARRDFTINALSMTASGEVFDYFCGIDDLHAGRVRFVGDAATRIAEDYLRILRFFRFFARYGSAGPDPQALAAITQGVPGLAMLSAERVWSELKRILSAGKPDASIALMQQTGVLRAMLPGASPNLVNHLPPDPLLRLAALRPATPIALAENLRLSVAEATALAALSGAPPPVAADDQELRRLLAETPAQTLIGRSWLAGQTEQIRNRIAAIPVPIFPVQGRDLLAAGMPPGPVIGETLSRLRAIWLQRGCTAGRFELLAELAHRPAP